MTNRSIQIPTQTIIEINSKEKGNTTTIMCGVHGNERHGIIAMNEILPKLEIIRGTVWAIYANIQAIEQNTRFIQENMNRLFFDEIRGDSYEAKRAREILEILKKSDYLLDLHASNSTKSEGFLITEHLDVAKSIPVNTVIHGVDTLEPGGSDVRMNNAGKIGLCLECGSIIDPKGEQVAKDSIINFLKFTGNIDGKPELRDKQNHRKTERIHITKNNFKLAKEFEDFEELKKGGLIGRDGDQEIITDKDCFILFARNREGAGEEAFLTGNI